MFEYFILGLVQGVAEWLPVSSEGVLVLLQTNWLQASLQDSLHVALFLHLGTFLAALVYFWSDVVEILKKFFKYFALPSQERQSLNFYVIATLVSGVMGYGLLQLVEQFEDSFRQSSFVINLAIAGLLLVTAYLQFKKKNTDQLRGEEALNTREGFIAGLMQGLASFPGISRSGSTTAILLLRKFTEESALKASFIMSLPIVLVGNIALNLNKGLFVSIEALIALLTAFVFGLLTIHGLLKIAKRINFGWFVLIFAILLIVATLIL